MSEPEDKDKDEPEIDPDYPKNPFENVTREEWAQAWDEAEAGEKRMADEVARGIQRAKEKREQAVQPSSPPPASPSPDVKSTDLNCERLEGQAGINEKDAGEKAGADKEEPEIDPDAPTDPFEHVTDERWRRAWESAERLEKRMSDEIARLKNEAEQEKSSPPAPDVNKHE